MKKYNPIKRVLNFFFFIDVTKIMQSLRFRQAEAHDLDKIEYINEMLKKPDSYPDLPIIAKNFRRFPLLSLIKFEKKSYIYMFFLHSADIILSLFAIYLSMQILVTFEKSNFTKFKFIHLFIENPNLYHQIIFAVSAAFLVFILNMMAASIHAQKIEKEMLLEWRIPTKITQTVYDFLLNMSAKDREKYQSGDITNIVQNDGGRFITGFFAHSFVDLGVIIFACFLITAFMLYSFGSAAWLGVIVIVLQIPLSLFFAWYGMKLHEKFMKYSDARIHMITEFIQGMRLLRYLSWGTCFEKDIKQITNKEFYQDTKLVLQFCISFSIITNLWMFISAAVFAGYLWHEQGIRDASIFFGIMWLAKLFGQQIAPLPWFLHTFSQSLVASKRIKKFFSSQTQEEEYAKYAKLHTCDNSEIKIIHKILKKEHKNDFSVSIELSNVSFRYTSESKPVLKNVNFVFDAQKITAITGQVGAGKTTLLKILTGEYLPTEGTVFLCVHLADSFQNKSIKINLHTPLGIQFLRHIQSLVPQEPFIVTSTIRENVSFDYHSTEQSNEYDSKVMNALLKASLLHDLDKFEDRLDTEIGERGVNLSGGQKQRLSLARKFYKNSKIVFMDDPFSAVDEKTEKEIIQNLFEEQSKNANVPSYENRPKLKKTIIWTTHRLQNLHISDYILVLEDGNLYEK